MSINATFTNRVFIISALLLLVACNQNAPSQTNASQSNSNVSSEAATGEQQEIPIALTSEDIAASWQDSSHGFTFVVDEVGQNNTCAQCHAPAEWQPSMDTIPESCFSCKFELDDPPPFISEQDWNSIPCYVCHKVDKHDQVEPEIAWLEIAAIGEYAEVESNDQLCNKCHGFSEAFEGHSVISLSGVHEDQACTDCHDPHSLTATCTDCHQELDFTAEVSSGHSQYHEGITCLVCHDNSGLSATLVSESGQWQLVNPTDEEQATPVSSHNLTLEAACSRCHYTNNPWALSVQP